MGGTEIRGNERRGNESKMRGKERIGGLWMLCGEFFFIFSKPTVILSMVGEFTTILLFNSAIYPSEI